MKETASNQAQLCAGCVTMATGFAVVGSEMTKNRDMMVHKRLCGV
jgi:hypothetical protein